MRRPSEMALAAYRLSLVTGANQEEIANVLQKQFREPVTQPKVSRMVRRVQRYLNAGNILPPPPKTPQHAKSFDPSTLELGERTDRLTKRQRTREPNP